MAWAGGADTSFLALKLRWMAPPWGGGGAGSGQANSMNMPA